MRAKLEKINPGFGSSFSIRKFNHRGIIRKPHWHFHPEYEIVFISNGSGKRHVGDHISTYEHGDLIFLGPDLPHFGFTDDLFEDHTEIVVQMKEDFLGKEFFSRPEMYNIFRLFERSKQGISFNGETKRRIGERLIEMVEMDNFERLISLLTILEELANAEDYILMNANGYAFEVNAQDQDRMQMIHEYVEGNYQDQISLEEVSKLINMTVPAFCRYFKKLTQKTFTQFVNELRVAHACRLLSDEHLSIASVSFESGFNNLSHFNKQFKSIAGLSPREYRKHLKKVVRTEA